MIDTGKHESACSTHERSGRRLRRIVRKRPTAVVFATAVVLWAFEPTPAQVQPVATQAVPADYAELAACKQFIPIASTLDKRIVDYISAPRPNFRCSDFSRVTWDGSKIYSIIRVSNSKFCQERYCYTVVYNERDNNIMMSVDADNIIDRFEHAKDHIISLKAIINHKFENTDNGLLLRVRDGLLAIAVVNEVLTVSIVPQKGGK